MTACAVYTITLVVLLYTSAAAKQTSRLDTDWRRACVYHAEAANSDVAVLTCTGDFRSAARLLPNDWICSKCIILVRDSIVDLRHAPLSPRDLGADLRSGRLRYCFINTTFVSWSRDWLLDPTGSIRKHGNALFDSRLKIELFFDSVSMSDTTEWREWVTRFDLCRLSALSFARSDSLLLALLNVSLSQHDPPLDYEASCTFNFLGAFDMDGFDQWSVVLEQLFNNRVVRSSRIRLSNLKLRSIPQFISTSFRNSVLQSSVKLSLRDNLLTAESSKTVLRYCMDSQFGCYVFLDNNPLGRIERNDYAEIAQLTLRNTSLSSFSSRRNNLNSNHLLDLRDNLLTYIDVDTIKAFSLKIGVSDEYADFPDCFSDGWSYIDSMDFEDSGFSVVYGYSKLLLDNNPWVCDSFLLASMTAYVEYYDTLNSYLNESLIDAIDVTMPRCFEPDGLSGRDWSTALSIMATDSEAEDLLPIAPVDDQLTPSTSNETQTITTALLTETEKENDSELIAEATNAEMWLLIAISVTNTVLIAATTTILRRAIYSDRDELPTVLPVEFAAVCEIRSATRLRRMIGDLDQVETSFSS